MAKRPTIQMIADRAGVSRGTVDRVINNRSYVKEEVRARVLTALQELEYFSPRQLHQQVLQAQDFAPLRFGVILPNWVGHSMTEFQRGIADAQEELKDFHVTVLIRECRTEIPDEVLELVDDLCEQHVNGIALCAVNDFAIEQKIAQITEQGIPVITFNSDLPQSKRICFIGQDYRKSGRIAGELMSKCVSHSARILAMVGNLEYNGHRTRLEGFCERMHELGFQNDQLEIAETYNDYSVTYKKVLSALQNTPRPEGIYMANRSVVGCVEAVKAAGLTGQVRIIVHDVSDTTRRLLKEGSLDLTISQDLYRQGYQPLILLRELLQKNKQPAANNMRNNISVICAENLE